MRVEQYNQTEPRRPITGLKKVSEKQADKQASRQASRQARGGLTLWSGPTKIGVTLRLTPNPPPPSAYP
jgi:hypothetical protein